MHVLQAPPSRSSGLCSQWSWVHPRAEQSEGQSSGCFCFAWTWVGRPRLRTWWEASLPGAVLPQPCILTLGLGGGDSEKHQPPFWKPGLWRLADIVVAESVSPLSASMLSGRVPVIGPGPALFQKPAHQCACAHLQWPSPYLCSEVDWFIAWSVAAVSLEALCSVALPCCPASGGPASTPC